MIILEGPDGGGKTTLLMNLLDEFPSIEQHAKASTSTGGPVDNIEVWAKEDVVTWPLQPLSFYDRHPMFSEPFYGSILRGGFHEWFGSTEAAELGQNMLTKGLIVFCLPKLETVTANLAAEEQLSGVVDHIDDLYNLYQRQMIGMAEDFPNTVFHYDYENPTDYDDLLAVINAHQTRYNRKTNGRTA